MTPNRTRVLVAAAASLTLGLAVVSVAAGPSGSSAVRVLQGLAVFAAGTVAFIVVVVLVLTKVAHWRQPESEFEAIVQRAERLGADWPGASDATSPAETTDEFGALVRAAVDELPLEFHRALEHVAIVVSDGGVRRGAYGLYEGDTIAQDYFHDRIVIFRDSLTRDFGHDPELLRAQVTRTLRHELAHHLGWGERGVRGLGL
ncbi:MAG: metallopeptidase family protein [Solirubrobacteraceae bacterium]